MLLIESYIINHTETCLIFYASYIKVCAELGLELLAVFSLRKPFDDQCGEKIFAISSAEFAVRIGLRLGVLLEIVLGGFVEAGVDNHFCVVTVALTRSTKLLPEAHVKLRLGFKCSAMEDL